jgi:hypothetical protein
MNNISITEIEVLFQLVLARLKADNLNNIQIDTDEYWIILTSEWGDFTKSPEPAVGSLNEDISYLRKSIAENEIFTYSDLDRLATVLRAISEIEAPTG